MNKKCQIFTPSNYVMELLDCIGYSKHLYGKKILENSCGDGNILTAVVQRYIDDCNMGGFSEEQTKSGLANDIYGIEIDAMQHRKCIENLNRILEKNNIGKVDWRVYNTDYLQWDMEIQFQFIVGNPPYITYSELTKEEQKYVKENFETCVKGKFDYCYAFIEKSIKSLTQDGKMSYLIPNSIFKTVFGDKLRDFIKPYLIEIRDYTQNKMFDDALVKSAIMVLDKSNKNPFLHYKNMERGESLDIDRNCLKGKWFFSTQQTIGHNRFGDFFQVAHVVATLLNEAYVIKENDYQEADSYYLCNGRKIEKGCVRETATPRTKRYHKEEKIIFPYYYEDNKLMRYSETEFKSKYPGTWEYLDDFRDGLEKRKKEKSALWFEYGRSQALSGLNSKKLLISTVITDKVSIYMLDEECIPYAGMYVISKQDNHIYSLEDAEKILKSDAFVRYVEKVGVHISGRSLRVTSKDIENYRF